MTDDGDKRELTEDQVVYLYERQMNFAILWNFTAGIAWIVAAVLLVRYVEPEWLGWVCGIAALILGGGYTQRYLASRVRCPACGGRVLLRIHSIFQARSVTECPHCDARLRH